MKKIPIWVKASERLPDMTKPTHHFHYNLDGEKSTGCLIFNNRAEFITLSGMIITDLSRVEWLDEVEVPTQKEIDEMSEDFYTQEGFASVYNLLRIGFKTGARLILNKLTQP